MVKGVINMLSLAKAFLVILGLFYLYLAYTIGIKKNIYAISNHKLFDETIKNKSISISLYIFLIGIINLFSPFLHSIMGDDIWRVYCIIILVGSIYLLIRLYNKYSI